MENEIWKKLDEAYNKSGRKEGRSLLCTEKSRDKAVCSIDCEITDEGKRAISIYDFDAKIDSELTRNKYNGFEVYYNPLKTRIVVIVSEIENNSIFSVFSDSLIEVLVSLKIPSEIEPAIINRLNAWAEFMKDISGKKLSPDEIRGLYGELYFLLNTLAPLTGIENAITAWRGPYKYPQDFLIEKTAVEIKTSVDKDGQKIKISNEQQLNNSGFSNLYLYHIRMARVGAKTDTLNDIVDRIIACCISDRKCFAEFMEKLTFAGYNREHHDEYQKTGIAIVRDNSHYYKVTDDFPCLTRVKYLKEYNWIADVSYTLNVAYLKDFEIPEDDVIKSIIGEL